MKRDPRLANAVNFAVEVDHPFRGRFKTDGRWSTREAAEGWKSFIGKFWRCSVKVVEVPVGRTIMARRIQIEELIAELQEISRKWGNTCVVHEAIKWGASALWADSDEDADKKLMQKWERDINTEPGHGVDDLGAGNPETGGQQEGVREQADGPRKHRRRLQGK